MRGMPISLHRLCCKSSSSSESWITIDVDASILDEVPVLIRGGRWLCPHHVGIVGPERTQAGVFGVQALLGGVPCAVPAVRQGSALSANDPWIDRYSLVQGSAGAGHRCGLAYRCESHGRSGRRAAHTP